MNFLLLISVIGILSTTIHAEEESAHFICDPKGDIIATLAEKDFATSRDLDYPSYPAIDCIKRINKLPTLSPDLKEKYQIIFQTAIMVSDAIDAVSGNRSVALVEMEIDSVIKTPMMIIDYMYDRVDGLKTDPIMWNKMCETIQPFANILNLHDKNVFNCMKELRVATTKDSKSTVEDIYKLIMETFSDRISENGVMDSTLLHDCEQFRNELEKTLKERDLEKVFAAHTSCLNKAAIDTETAMQLLLTKLQSVIGDKYKKETVVKNDDTIIINGEEEGYGGVEDSPDDSTEQQDDAME